MLRQLQNNNRGVVFVMVIMTVIILMILAVSIISMNTSHILVTEDEVKRIQAETLAAGAYIFAFANQTSSTASSTPAIAPVTLGNITYTITATRDGTCTGLNDTDCLDITVDY
jgi:type II secretory pathway component PulK